MRGVIGAKIGLAGERGSIRGRMSAVWRAGNERISARTGFTLVELLAVIVIMALLLTAVVPSISGLARGAALRGATLQVRTALAQSRQRAIMFHGQGGVLFPTYDNDTNTGFRAITIIARQRCGPIDPWSNVTDWVFLPAGVVFDSRLATVGNQMGAITNADNPRLHLQGARTPLCWFDHWGGRGLGGAVNLMEGWVDNDGTPQGRPNGATNRIEIRAFIGGTITCKRL